MKMPSLSARQSRTASNPDQGSRTPRWLNALIVLGVLLTGVWALYELGFKATAPQVAAVEEVVPGNEGFSGMRDLTGLVPARPARLERTNRNGLNDSGGRFSPGGRFNSGGGFGPGGGFNSGGGFSPGGRNSSAGRNENISRMGAGIRARHDDLELRAEFTPAKGVHGVTLDYAIEAREKWVNSHEFDLHMAAWKATRFANIAQSIDLTQAQRTQLEALTYDLKLTPGELGQFTDALTAWVKNGGRTEAAAIYALMDQAGKAHQAQVKQSFRVRVQTIGQILTGEQLAKLDAGASPVAPASTRRTPAAPRPATPAPKPAGSVATGQASTAPTARPAK